MLIQPDKYKYLRTIKLKTLKQFKKNVKLLMTNIYIYIMNFK